MAVSIDEKNAMLGQKGLCGGHVIKILGSPLYIERIDIISYNCIELIFLQLLLLKQKMFSVPYCLII